MTPLEVTQLTDEDLNQKIREIVVPDWCGFPYRILWSDYAACAWQCPVCQCFVSAEDYMDRHMPVNFAQDIGVTGLLLDEMQCTLTTFNGVGTGWTALLEAWRGKLKNDGGTCMALAYTEDGVLNTGSGKALPRAVSEAFLVFMSNKSPEGPDNDTE